MSVEDVSVDHLAEKLSDGAIVVDVREPEEYVQAHVPGAELLPMGEVVAAHQQIPRGQPVYVICAVGGRSAQVAEFLNDQGVDARNVAGGTLAWVRAGHPVASGMDAS